MQLPENFKPDNLMVIYMKNKPKRPSKSVWSKRSLIKLQKKDIDPSKIIWFIALSSIFESRLILLFS